MTLPFTAGARRAPEGGPRRPRRPTTAIAGVPAVLLVLGVAAVAVPWLSQVPHPEQAALVLLDLLLLATSLAIGISGGFRPLITMSAAFAFAWIALPALFQLAHGLAAWGDDDVVALRWPVTAALALVAAAQASLLAGYAAGLLLRRRRPEESRTLAMPAVSSEVVRDRSLGLAVVLVGAALAALPAVARVLGGVQVLFASRSSITDAAADAGVALTESGGVAVALLRVVPMSLAVAGTLLAVQYLQRERRSSWPRVAAWATSLVGAALVIAYANPLANSRFTALSALGSVVLLLARPRSRAAGAAVVVAFVAFMLFAYPLANAFRGDGASSLDDIQPAGGAFAYLASRDYDGFQQIINSFLFVGQRGHTGGHYLLSAFLVFVPRAIWADKAQPASLDVAAARGYSFTDLSLPTNAELYIDFGWAGVVVVFLLLGFVYARLDRTWLQGDRFGALVAFAALAQIGIIRGPLGSIVPVVDLTLLALAIEAVLHARATRTPSRRT